jgi:hypothetical protein
MIYPSANGFESSLLLQVTEHGIRAHGVTGLCKTCSESSGVTMLATRRR